MVFLPYMTFYLCHFLLCKIRILKTCFMLSVGRLKRANGQIKNVLHVSKPANAPALSIVAKSRASLSLKELEVEHSRGRERTGKVGGFPFVANLTAWGIF